MGSVPRSLFSCVVSSRHPGGERPGVREVDGSVPGVGLVAQCATSFSLDHLRLTGTSSAGARSFIAVPSSGALGLAGEFPVLRVAGLAAPASAGPGSSTSRLRGGLRHLLWNPGLRWERPIAVPLESPVCTTPSTGSGQALRQALRRCSGTTIFRAGTIGWALRQGSHARESPSLRPSPVEGEGLSEPGSGRILWVRDDDFAGGNARCVGLRCSSRTMCEMSSLAAAMRWWGLKPSSLPSMTASRNSTMAVAVSASGLVQAGS